MSDEKRPKTYIQSLYNAAELLFNEKGERRADGDPKRKRALEILESIKDSIAQDPLSGRSEPD